MPTRIHQVQFVFTYEPSDVFSLNDLFATVQADLQSARAECPKFSEATNLFYINYLTQLIDITEFFRLKINTATA